MKLSPSEFDELFTPMLPDVHEPVADYKSVDMLCRLAGRLFIRPQLDTGSSDVQRKSWQPSAHHRVTLLSWHTTAELRHPAENLWFQIVTDMGLVLGRRSANYTVAFDADKKLVDEYASTVTARDVGWKMFGEMDPGVTARSDAGEETLPLLSFDRTLFATDCHRLTTLLGAIG
jgi:hypothetical protein